MAAATRISIVLAGMNSRYGPDTTRRKTRRLPRPRRHAARQIVREAATKAATRKREEAAAAERERVLAEFLGRQMLAQLRAEELKRQQKTDGVVVACVEWFTKEGREISPEAIANFLNQPEYSRDIVAAALARLHA